MKIKGPKNQPDFIEVLYVVLMPGAPLFEIHGNMVRTRTINEVLKNGAPYVLQDHLRMKFTYSFIGHRNTQIFSLNNAEN